MLQINDIEKQVPGKTILNKINCNIKTGMTFIIGDSGAGKSTFLNIIGMLDDFTSGDILYTNGNNSISYNTMSNAEKINFKSRHIGFIFQDSNLIDCLGAYDNVAIAMELSGQTPDHNIITKLHKLGIEDVNKPVQLLSGGEKQRVAIIRAIEKNADIILADEPTGSLDSKNAETVFKMLKEISKNKIVIVVTHNIEKAKEYADSIIKIKDGSIESVIENNSIETEEYEKTELTGKRKVSFNYIKKLSRKNINKFKSKYISVIVVMSIAIASAISMMTMKYMVDNKIDEMNYAYYDADIIDVDYEFVENKSNVRSVLMNGRGVPLNEADFEYADDIDDFAEVVPVVNISLYCDGIVGGIDLRPIKINDFFKNRIMCGDIEGRFPDKSDEIIIGEDIAKKFGDCIGENIVIRDSYNNEYSFVVSGINHSRNVDGIFWTYIDYNNFSNVNLTANCANLFISSMFKEANRNSFSSSSSGFIEKDMPDGIVLYGKSEPEENEMVVSIDIFSDLCYEITGNYNIYKESDFSNTELIKEEIEAVFGEGVYLEANDAYLAKVVGVHNGGSTTIYVGDKWYDEISILKVSKLQCYTTDIETAKTFDTEQYSSKYHYNSYYQERFESAVENNSMWKLLFVIATVIALILVVVLTNSFARITISERTYEIGIIKSLGGNKKYIFLMLMWDQINIGLISSIFASMLYGIFLVIMNNKCGYEISEISTAVLIIFLTIAVTLVLCIVSTSMKIFAVAKSNPIDDIRKRI